MRILVFGDSFAAGSRLPYDETWTARLEASGDRLEVVNFGVDGFGVGQAYLRYQEIRDRIDFDVVQLMVVPEVQLWRDINVRRDVGDRWNSFTVMPRYELDENGLHLITDPLPSLSGHEERRMAALRRHLRTHDRLYVPAAYELPPVLGRSVIYKLALAAYAEQRRTRIRSQLFEPESEAARVTEAIIAELRHDVERRGKQFVLLLAPRGGALTSGASPAPDWESWERLAGVLCAAAGHCIDLSAHTRDEAPESFDLGYDGTHYGPVTSRRIAEIIRAELSARGLLDTPSVTPARDGS